VLLRAVTVGHHRLKLAAVGLAQLDVVASLMVQFILLDLSIIRYVICGAFLVRLCFSKNGVMVSPSGMQVAGSTNLRTGRRLTVG
jgi:hypothetical protein